MNMYVHVFKVKLMYTASQCASLQVCCMLARHTLVMRENLAEGHGVTGDG